MTDDDFTRRYRTAVGAVAAELSRTNPHVPAMTALAAANDIVLAYGVACHARPRLMQRQARLAALTRRMEKE